MVGYDWGATNAWYLCLLRPDRVKRLVNATMTWLLRNLERKPDESIRAMFGDDYCSRFQNLEWQKRTLQKLISPNSFSYSSQAVTVAPRDVGISGLTKPLEQRQVELPSWLTEDDINYNAIQFSRTGFTGGLNYTLVWT
ncbi:epoxide hydrolase A-like [Eucalyptus grandis]|uniref:epoxide hydrolase A-like n=1 Tax=Eucalyptus grandis TaxID=71139 RepID=UPI00192ECE45|nr:epoxide hydrolase A-like [Eucalyptus grandis]